MKQNITSLMKQIQKLEKELKEKTEEYTEKRENFVSVFRMTLATKPYDFNEQQKKIEEKATLFKNIINWQLEQINKIQELKNKLFEVNKANGIDVLLNKIAMKKKEIAYLTSLKNNTLSYRSSSVDEDKNFEFTFDEAKYLLSEENKITTFRISYLTDKEYKELELLKTSKKEELEALEAELAYKNHTIMV